jgi:hypothetical protein
MKELDDFFGLNWKRNKPKIFLVKDRESINKLMGMKTQDWIVGWANNQDVFVLDKDTYEKESCHTYSDDEYFRLIKHELAHVFTRVYSGIFNKSIEPDWLWEGVAIYLSDQNKTKKKPNQLNEFLQHYSQDNKNSSVYKESGFAIEFLVKNFGKQKLLKLIKSLKEINYKDKFAKKFKEIYGFELNYKNFQKPSKK